MFVNNWATDLFENPAAEELLKSWREKLAPFYEEGSVLRKRTVKVLPHFRSCLPFQFDHLQRLTTAYWVELFSRKVTEDEQQQEVLSSSHVNGTTQ